MNKRALWDQFRQKYGVYHRLLDVIPADRYPSQPAPRCTGGPGDRAVGGVAGSNTHVFGVSLRAGPPPAPAARGRLWP
jgi:hypothetical protein